MVAIGMYGDQKLAGDVGGAIAVAAQSTAVLTIGNRATRSPTFQQTA